MKKFTLLMAAAASLLLMSCNKDNEFANSILGTWEGYSRSKTLTKNGQAVSAETYLTDLISCGEMEAPKDDKERAELLEDMKEYLYDEYLMKGDEDLTITFDKDGKCTSVYTDEEPITHTGSYTIKNGQLILTEGSETQTANIEKLNGKEMVLGYDNPHSYHVEEPLIKLGYSTYERVTFVKK